MRKLKNKNRQLCWFLTNRQLGIMVMLFLLAVMCQIGNVAVNLTFLSAQKAVQNGNMEMWEVYLAMLLALSVFSVFNSVFMTYFYNTLNRFLAFNLFKKYRRCFKIMERGVLMKYNIVHAELNLPLTVIATLCGIYTIFKTMTMVTFSTQNIVVGLILLVSAIGCGIIRGKSESARKKIDVVISEKKNDITKFDTFSRAFLSDALYVLDLEYKAATKHSVRRMLFEKLPRFLKELLYVILVWGLVDTVATGKIYSESYLILTAYGTILSIAEEIGKMLEKSIEIFQMRRDPEVIKVDEFWSREQELQVMNGGNLILDENGLTIKPELHLDVNGATGNVRLYKLSEEFNLPAGKHAILNGEKEVGKTRLLTFVEAMFEDGVMIYNDASKVFDQLRDNFKNQYGLDCNLIRELAKGLKLHRFAHLTNSELKKLQITNINTGDKHLCVALVMLYYGIKNPNSAKIMVLDELFANVDEDNSKDILEFIMEKAEEIGCSVIFVGHSKQELIRSHCNMEITLRREGESVVVFESKEI